MNPTLQPETETTKNSPLKLLKKLWKNWALSTPYEDNPQSYAYGLNPYKLMLLFCIGCFLGYVLETIWYFSLRGCYVNRQGVLYGPFSPIYGIAFVGAAVLLYRLRHCNAIHLFLICAVLGGVFEYTCSILQEYILGTRSWDYSHLPYNIQGRVCLRMMIVWGIMGTIFIRSTYPFLSKCIENLPSRFGKALAISLSVFLVLDCLLSLAVSLRQTARLKGVEPQNRIESAIDAYYTDERLAHIYTEIRRIE